MKKPDFDIQLEGWNLWARHLPLLQVIKPRRGKKMHLVRLVTTRGVRPICFTPRVPTIQKYEVVGELYEERPKVITIHHSCEWCQGCKMRLRRLAGIKFTRLMTCLLPPLYLGQPKVERIATFMSDVRDPPAPSSRTGS